jgi:hypothetical protein
LTVWNDRLKTDLARVDYQSLAGLTHPLGGSKPVNARQFLTDSFRNGVNLTILTVLRAELIYSGYLIIWKQRESAIGVTRWKQADDDVLCCGGR